MGMFDIIGKMKKLNNGEKVKLTYADICNCIINVQDAKKSLTKEQFDEFYELYKKFQKAKTTEYEVDMEGYYEMCFDIITKFDKIAPYEQYSGASEIETSFLMDEIRRIEKERNSIKNDVKDFLDDSFGLSDEIETEENNSEIPVLNRYRNSDIKRLLIEKGNNLPESDYMLYGNMFDIIAKLTDNKLDNQTMVDAFDELSDLILGKIPSFMAIVPKEQRMKIQIRYMNEKGLLQNLTDNEKEMFAYCVWHATCIIVADDNGNMNSGLIDFDSIGHINALYKEDKERQPDIFPSSDEQIPENIDKDNFGYSADNPIHTTSISSAYKLLKKIEYYGEPVNMVSQAAIETKSGHLVDLYELETPSGKTVEIYIDSYSNNNSDELPKGFDYISTTKSTNQTVGKSARIIKSSINDELKDIDEYREACDTIDKLNGTIHFKEDPKILSDKIVNTLNNETTDKYYELLDEFNKTNNSDVLVELSDLMSLASNQLHKMQYPKSPICQWEFEMYGSPQLYWALEAAKLGNVEGFVREQRYLDFRGVDSIKAPEGLKKAIELKFAYEGDSDMQYQLFHRYDPSEEHYFNGPAVNEAEKDQAKADFWMNKLVNNMNIKPNSSMVYRLRDAKGPGVERMFEKAAELDDVDSYYYIAKHFGIDNEIGFKFYKKCAESEDGWASVACSEVLHEYKRRNDKDSCKQLLNHYVSLKHVYSRQSDSSKLYEKEYTTIFKWIDDIEFDNAYMDSAISISNDEYYKKEAIKIKNKHIGCSIFGGKPVRKN